jgi:hypothetical protein
MTFYTDKNNKTFIITSITARPIGHAAILAIIYVSAFKTVIILYLWGTWTFSL